jgi:hypothetical protein
VSEILPQRSNEGEDFVPTGTTKGLSDRPLKTFGRSTKE